MKPGRVSIVNVSSAWGKMGAAGASVHVASKFAVEGLTRSAALEFATSGIRINAVANLIVFAASDKASYVTGQSLPVDGGITAWSATRRPT